MTAPIQFDWNVNLGNVIMAVTFLFAGIKAWQAHTAAQRDLEWRIANLEAWRKEHMVDADTRDALIRGIDNVVRHTQWQSDWLFKYLERQGIHPTSPPTALGRP